MKVFQLIATNPEDLHFEINLIDDTYHAAITITHRTVCGVQLDGDDGIGAENTVDGEVTCRVCKSIIEEIKAM